GHGCKPPRCLYAGASHLVLAVIRPFSSLIVTTSTTSVNREAERLGSKSWRAAGSQCVRLRYDGGVNFFRTAVQPAGRQVMELFRHIHEENLRKAQPLAARMRPRTVEEFVGQEHFFGQGKLLRRLLQADRLGSLIFYGPPGTGKTALAHVIANH